MHLAHNIINKLALKMALNYISIAFKGKREYDQNIKTTAPAFSI